MKIKSWRFTWCWTDEYKHYERFCKPLGYAFYVWAAIISTGEIPTKYAFPITLIVALGLAVIHLVGFIAKKKVIKYFPLCVQTIADNALRAVNTCTKDLPLRWQVVIYQKKNEKPVRTISLGNNVVNDEDSVIEEIKKCWTHFINSVLGNRSIDSINTFVTCRKKKEFPPKLNVMIPIPIFKDLKKTASLWGIIAFYADRKIDIPRKNDIINNLLRTGGPIEMLDNLCCAHTKVSCVRMRG